MHDYANCLVYQAQQWVSHMLFQQEVIYHMHMHMYMPDYRKLEVGREALL